jgi:hypothetical protein
MGYKEVNGFYKIGELLGCQCDTRFYIVKNLLEGESMQACQ